MSSLLHESNLNWFQRFAIRLLQCGPIPNHIAFIMDGNRRYAEKNNLKCKSDGHVKGFDKLMEVFQWCWDIGIKELTVYAFSIENFKRSKEEVDALMHVMKMKLVNLIDDEDKLNEQGKCFRFVGNLSMIPLDLRKLMATLMLMTKNNKRIIFNIAFAYTSRDEMTESIRTILNGVESLDLNVDDINEDLIRRCMYFSDSPDPDLIIRTSGESRLSDFMTHQCSTTILYFEKQLWPELGIWGLLALIFYYQQHNIGMVNARRCLDSYDDEAAINANKERVEFFVKQIEERRMIYLKDLISDAKGSCEVAVRKNNI